MFDWGMKLLAENGCWSVLGVTVLTFYLMVNLILGLVGTRCGKKVKFCKESLIFILSRMRDKQQFSLQFWRASWISISKLFFSYKYTDLIPICRIQKLFEKVNMSLSSFYLPWQYISSSPLLIATLAPGISCYLMKSRIIPSNACICSDINPLALGDSKKSKVKVCTVMEWLVISGCILVTVAMNDWVYWLLLLILWPLGMVSI